MTKERSELVSRILTAVENGTGIDRAIILSKRRNRETVDARHILVKILSEQGFYTPCVAVLTGMTPRQANNVLFDFENRIRCSRQMRNIWETIRKDIGIN